MKTEWRAVDMAASVVLRVQDGRDALLIVVFETPSIHHVKPLILFRVTGGLEPMPADIGRRSTSWVTRRFISGLTCRDKTNIHAHIHTNGQFRVTA